jgi:hypothetical protein
MTAGQATAVVSNILKPHGFWAAKNIAAFFSTSHIRRENSPPDCFLIRLISRSMRFSLRNRSFSQSSSASCAGTFAASENTLTHLPRVECPIPKSDAT